jgi:flagellin-like protein
VSTKYPEYHDRGVSEVIGSILLISIVVLGVSLVGVFLFSQPTAQKIPSLNAIISNDTQYIYIKHDGGDSLNSSEIKFYVNGTDQTSNFHLSTSPTSSWTYWTIGNTLQYATGATPVKSVLVVWNGPGSSAVVLTSMYQ